MDLDRLINWAAGQASRAYPQITFADVRQELHTHCIANLPRFFEYMQRGEEGERIIRAALNREARKYAMKEREAVTGISFEDQAWYTPKAIRSILPDVYEYANWQSFGASAEERKPTAIINATGDRLAAIIDVKAALEKILPDQRDLLWEYYHLRDSVSVIAERRDISEAATNSRITRAVYAVREALGGPRPSDPYEATNGQFDTRSKGRRAVSNSAARRMTEGNY